MLLNFRHDCNQCPENSIDRFLRGKHLGHIGIKNNNAMLFVESVSKAVWAGFQ